MLCITVERLRKVTKSATKLHGSIVIVFDNDSIIKVDVLNNSLSLVTSEKIIDLSYIIFSQSIDDLDIHVSN